MKKISKTKLAKNLGISRPTLYKRLKNNEKVTLEKVSSENQKLIIHFLGLHSTFSPRELEEILESLQDYGFLNKEGVLFRADLWKLFIKE